MYVGVLGERDKYEAMTAARAVIQPSSQESLSLVALEAWSVGTPVVVNGRCDVLRGQCRRANAGLWYESYEEFREVLTLLLRDPGLGARLGAAGRRFVDDACRWDTVEAQYRRLVARALGHATDVSQTA